jgi:hypothetical protein
MGYFFSLTVLTCREPQEIQCSYLQCQTASTHKITITCYLLTYNVFAAV